MIRGRGRLGRAAPEYRPAPRCSFHTTSDAGDAAEADSSSMTLAEQFGEIDIYLFDQLLRGRIRPGMRVLDAGCGAGRNLIYMLRAGYEVFAADADAAAVQHVQRLAASLAPALPAANIVAAPVEQMPFPDAFADVVISSAVLHFARDDRQFDAMVREMWRVLKSGGLLWARLASTIGIADQVRSRHLAD